MSKKYPYPITPKFDIDNGRDPHCIETIKWRTPYYDCVDEVYPGYSITKTTVFLDKIPTEALVQELANRKGVRVRMYSNGKIYALEFPD